MDFKTCIGNIYTGKEFTEICREKNLQIVKFLRSNDLTAPQAFHHNFHYKIGINSIPDNEVIFDLKKQCCGGGLYFTVLEEKWRESMWLERHCFKIQIPSSSRVFIEGEDKFKTNALFLVEEMNEDFYVKNAHKYYKWFKDLKDQTEEICFEVLKQKPFMLTCIREPSLEMYKFAVEQNGMVLMQVPSEKQTPEICLAAVKKFGGALHAVHEQTDEICKAAVKNYGGALCCVKKQTVEICRIAVTQDPFALYYVKEQTHEICMDAVRKNGWALMYVKDRTPALCNAAVENDGEALKFILEQNEEICIKAVKQNGRALRFVNKQTPEICLFAVKENGNALLHVNHQTSEICRAAVAQNPKASCFIRNRERHNSYKNFADF